MEDGTREFTLGYCEDVVSDTLESISTYLTYGWYPEYKA